MSGAGRRQRFTFRDTELVETTPPAVEPPARFDAVPGISAEKAVERGIATPVEEAWVEWMREEPLVVETGDTIEVELDPEQMRKGAITSYVVNDAEAPLLANPDGTFTRLDNATQEGPTHE